MNQEIRKIEVAEDIFVLENLLSPEECEVLIYSSEELGFEEATIFDGREHRMLKSVRNNLRLVSYDQEFANELWGKVKPYFSESIHTYKSCGLNERFRFYKYEVGHRFRKHKDGAFVRSEGDRSIYTFMIYLNDDFEGGTTDFDNGISVKPKTGSALVFLHPCRHEGKEDTSGVKYAIRSDVMYKR